ncbi:TPA: tyrosine--tRNA ligase [Candidatus Sumerlaeota bacterium]|nr:tyrosine--tRNA ligase [Candidatus Sumerlaeota bacterium]
MSNAFETLQARGFIEAVSDAAIGKYLQEGARSIYAGFDPTADSLHLGHLVPILALAHFQRAGHNVIALVGGATGMVGDPSGRSSERNLLTADDVAHNARCLKTQMQKFIDFNTGAQLLDNNDWIGKMTFIDWLRDVGKYFTINYMINKESVRKRMENEQGISYTEFSYMTMQAYDFLHLRREHNCTIEVGGSDQWGNITAGMDLIKRVLGNDAHAYGITFPLMQTANGEKFGKSAGNAVWLDPARTSPFQFYQYWIRTDDRDVERFLKIFTFLELDEIAAIVQLHNAKPEERYGQKRIAQEMTRTVHGEAELAKVERASAVLFGGGMDGLTDQDLAEIFPDVPSRELPRTAIEGDGTPLADLLVQAQVAASKGEARRLIQGGGVNLNNQRMTDPMAAITTEQLVGESAMVLRTGKKNYTLLRFPK